MMENILNLDREFLIYLNNLGSNNWDLLWLTLTNKLTYFPFFLFVIYLIFKNFSIKQSLFILLSIAMLILLTDQFTNVIKDPITTKDTLINKLNYTIELISKHDLNSTSKKSRLITYYHLFTPN